MVRSHNLLLAQASVLALVLPLTAVGDAAAAAADPAAIQQLVSRLHQRSGELSESVGNGLCGAISECTAVHLLGGQATVHDFYSSQFIGSCRGSTADQIVSMLQHAGAVGAVVSGLGAWELRFLSGPLIANVRSRAASPEFDHWCVVIRDSQGIIMFGDDGRPTRITVGEFLGLWSGMGVVASRTDAGVLMHLRAARIIPFTAFFLLAAIAGLGRNFLRSEASRTKRTAISWIPIGGVVLCGMLFFGDPVNHAAGMRAAIAPFAGTHIDEIALSEFVEFVDEGTRLLVDARRRADFDRGSISGAISIPVNLSAAELRWLLEGVPRETPIVVFCQSQACPYDRIVAEQLVSMSFNNVVVCNAGYREYSELPLKQHAVR